MPAETNIAATPHCCHDHLAGHSRAVRVTPLGRRDLPRHLGIAESLWHVKD